MSVGERLAVGLVRGLHGLNGMVRVEMLTDRPEERFRRGAQIFREGSDDALTVASAQPAAPGWLVRFAEISDRSAAESLRDAYLEGVVEPGDELPRGEYYWHEVEGARVLDIEGRELGTVVDVYRAGGAEVFVVRGDAYGEFDLPAVRDFVRIFAPKRGEIVADVGALDLTTVEDRARRPRGRRSSRGQTPPSGAKADPEPQTEANPEPPAEPTGQP
jgi:16S rRNA processing protein RimM